MKLAVTKMKSLEHYTKCEIPVPVHPIPHIIDEYDSDNLSEAGSIPYRNDTYDVDLNEYIEFQKLYADYMKKKHSELKKDVCNAHNMSDAEYHAMLKKIRHKYGTATIERIYNAVMNPDILNDVTNIFTPSKKLAKQW